MSIFFCNECQKLLDSDFKGHHKLDDDKEYCDDCDEELLNKQKQYWEPLWIGEKLGGFINTR